jgi:hypothetical protein
MSWLRPRAPTSPGLHAVFSSYGIDFDDIDVFIWREDSDGISTWKLPSASGLCPASPSTKIVQAGNTAIEGATIALLSKVEASGIGRPGKEGRALPPGNSPELLRFLCGGLPVQARGADSMREVAETIELAGTLPDVNVLPRSMCGCSAIRAAGCSKAGSWNWRIGRATGTRSNGRPWFYARQAESFEIAAIPFTLMECTFTSKRLQSTLQQAEAHSVILVAVGAGPEAEEEARRRWEDEKPTSISSLRYSVPRSSSI